MQTPVVVCLFNRRNPLSRVMKAVAAARPSKLYLVADGPRRDFPGDLEACESARDVACAVDWPCEVFTDFAPTNLGLARRMYTGLSWVFSLEERAIILEDDCVPDASFFPFCEELLERHRDDQRVLTINGDTFQDRNLALPYSYWFSRYPHSWGWASWRRAWKLVDFEMRLWPEARAGGWLRNWFEDDAAVRHWEEIFDKVASGRIGSWYYRFVFACMMNGGLSIVPSVNLVSNLGFDEAGTHCIGPSPLADQPRGAMSFPLRHPPFVFANRDADRYYEEFRIEQRVPHRRAAIRAREPLTLQAVWQGEVNSVEALRLGDTAIPAWAAEMARLDKAGVALPSGIDTPDLEINPARLARFLTEFNCDAVVESFAILDAVACSAGAPLCPGPGRDAGVPLLASPEDLFEQVWLFHALDLAAGALAIVLHGCANSHLAMLAAAAGNRVTCVAGDAAEREAARRCVETLGIPGIVFADQPQEPADCVIARAPAPEQERMLRDRLGPDGVIAAAAEGTIRFTALGTEPPRVRTPRPIHRAARLDGIALPGFAYRAYRMAREWQRDSQRICAKVARLHWQLERAQQASLDRLEALGRSREVQKELGLLLKEAYEERQRIESTLAAKLLRKAGSIFGK